MGGTAKPGEKGGWGAWWAGAAILSAGVTLAVGALAWVSEDAFITLRYVSNTLGGHGAVFNVGERVQGYTHPLWFLLLVPACRLLGDGILASIACGLALTLLTLAVLVRSVRRVAPCPAAAVGAYALACAALVSSDSWLSFQTGGLENSLSHFILLLALVEAFFHGGTRPGRLLLFLGLLCLSRPDFVFFAFPLGVLVLPHLRARRARVAALAAVSPCAAWLAFAWAYYGAPLPNTGTAKLGIYSDWTQAVRRGAVYLLDACVHDSIAAASVLLFLGSALFLWRKGAVLATAIGTVLHGAWVTWIGGDFMRGRFFLPMFTASVAMGSVAGAAGWPRGRRGGLYAMCAVCAGLVTTGSLVRWVGGTLLARTERNASDIVNERKYYTGYSLRSYLREGRLTNPYLDLTLADDLRAYAGAFGPVTVHNRNPGTLAYLAGPRVSVIDTLGLTDRYIARLPRAYISNPDPRPGHPDKYIPVSYLASRGDVALLPDWRTRIRRMDGSLRNEVDALRGSRLFWSPDERLVFSNLPTPDPPMASH